MTDIDAIQHSAAETAAVAEPVAKDPTALLHEVASQMGWSPKEKWKGDPDDWRDADEYLKRTPQMLKSLKKQVETSSRIAAERIEAIRKKAVEEAEARIAAAVETGDLEEASRAMEARDRANTKPDPAVIEFAARNSWFNTNEMATQLAIAKGSEIANTGGSVAAQLEAAEAEVKKRFPELFDDAEVEAKPSKEPPTVHGGAQRSPAPAAREKGWNDLPKYIQSAATPKFLKAMDLTQAEYAKVWFKENA